MYDLWTEASRDLTAENEQRALEMAKHASQGLWAFLAQASDHLEYSDRLELARDRVEAVASSTGAPVEKLLEVFDQRFALLMQASDNPFGDDDSDSDDTDEDGDGSTDDDGESSDKGDETDQGGDDDSSDDSDTSEDSDDDSDDGDDDSDDEDGGDDNANPFGKSARYASLLARIEAGENPLSWGGTPFARSSARVTAAGANDDFVSDTNVPNPTSPANGLFGAPGPMPSLPETTKPRQVPEGSGGGFPDPSGMFGEETDPALNGGDIGAGADDLPPSDSGAKEAKVQAIAADVQATNPHLSPRQCERVARQVVAKFYKKAEDLSPLLYGDRGNVKDGPFTQQVKEYEPKPPKMKAPGGGAPAAAGEEAAAGAAGAGEAAALAEGAEALAPLLLL